MTTSSLPFSFNFIELHEIVSVASIERLNRYYYYHHQMLNYNIHRLAINDLEQFIIIDKLACVAKKFQTVYSWIDQLDRREGETDQTTNLQTVHC